MLIVIFRAKVRTLDDEYARVAQRMRALALEAFGCLEFVSIGAGDDEIALSYWPSEEAISAWRRHSEHVLAQALGRERWYEAYRVEIARVERNYDWSRPPAP